MARRVAALYDVHANLPALEAVLTEVEREGVDLVVVGGDVVPGPWPRETLTRLLELEGARRFIVGNGEADVLATDRGDVPERVPASVHDTLRWVAAKLTDRHKQALSEWPATTRLDIEGMGDVLFCHATPRDDNELFTRVTPEARLRGIMEAPGADVVLCGHTHMPFDRRIGAVRVVNAGSVGLPFGALEAQWALLGPDVELRRTRYDVATTAAEIRESDYPAIPGLDLEHPPSEEQMLEVFEAASVR